jgi:hypothetical protein
MLVLLSLLIGFSAGLTGRGATYVVTAVALLACWTMSAAIGGASLWTLATAVLLYNCGLALSFVPAAVFSKVHSPAR